MIKLYQLYDHTVATNQHLLMSNVTMQNIPTTSWLHEYIENASAYDTSIDFLFSQREFIDHRFNENASIETNLDRFRMAWDSFSTILNKQFQLAYDTLYAEYNPLWNVDGTETTEYSDFEKELPTPTITTKRNAFQDTDSTTLIADSEVSGTTVTETDKEHTTTLTRKGNIGVTSTQNLIGQELELRKKDFFMEKLNQFINIYTKWE